MPFTQPAGPRPAPLAAVRSTALAALLVALILGGGPAAEAAEAEREITGPADFVARRLQPSLARRAGDSAEPLSLVVTHLDGDGAPDLVVGAAADGGGRLRGYRGRHDASGRLLLGPGAMLAHLPQRPDFLAAGDFDRDGLPDLVAASREAPHLWWLRGLGGGRFSAPVALPLPAPPTALAAGAFDVADGLDDLAVAVSDGHGSWLLLYRAEEALFPVGAPTIVPLREPARELRLADLAGGPGRDALAVGEWVETLVHGADRLGEEARAPHWEEIVRSDDPARLTHRDERQASWVELHTNADAFADFVTWTDSGELVAIESTAAATFTVDSNGDAADANTADGVCATSGGICTLRAAIQQANASAGADTINFSVNPGAPIGFPQTITLASTLPSITQAVTIIGPNSNGARIFVTSGYSSTTAGFRLAATSVAIKNLSVTGFAGYAISILSSGGGAIVQGCALTGNAHGIWIQAGDVLIGGTLASLRNRISGNSGNGIFVEGTAGTGISILGNWIGLNAAGTGPQANGGRGIRLGRGAEVGGSMTGARNVISANGGGGISIHAGHGAAIYGNYIGTDAAGATAVDNQSGVLVLGGVGHQVGGASPSLRNVIAGSYVVGILIGEGGISPPEVAVRGNTLGLDASGTSALGPGLRGILVGADAGSVIGGSTEATRNVISGHTAEGILLSSGYVANTFVQGNVIGLDAALAAAVPNGVGIRVDRAERIFIGELGGSGGNVVAGNLGDGILIESYESWGHVIARNHVGITPADAPFGNGGHGIHVRGTPADLRIEDGNRIAHNGGDGIALVTAGGWTPDGVEIHGNRIWDNSGLAIDLGDDGVTANDAGDGDSGPNRLQNFPVVDAAFIGGSSMIVRGRLHAEPLEEYRLHFYESPGCDSSGHGEAFKVLPDGVTTVTTDAAGRAEFQVLSASVFNTGWWVTATATPTTGVPPGGTSELSRCREIAATDVIFADGFESGGTGAWSSVVGG